MAQDDAQDRNLPASARKLQKAREEGQVARSKDFGHFAAFAAAAALLLTLAPTATAWVRQILIDGLTFDRHAIESPALMLERLATLAWRLVAIVLPFGAAMAAVGIAGSLVIGGWNWTFAPLTPKFGKLNPISGLSNLISKDRLVDVLKASVLAIVLLTIGGFHLRAHLGGYTALLALPLPAALQQALGDVGGGALLLLLALALFALVDVPLQKFQHAQRLRMSHQEAKQEHKEAEGNQEVKGRMRQRMREMSRRRMLAAVPAADLVVMNPTHYAVALKYDEERMAAPRVVAKGADLLALRIRDLAKDERVPVLEAPALARALYAHAELDHEIPAALFGAVAQVLAYVYQLRAALAGRGAEPRGMPELNVPPELDPHRTPARAQPDFEDSTA